MMTQTTARHERASEQHISPKRVPLRKCLVTGESYDKAELLRFVASPSGEVVPDFGADLPGRGFYLVPTRENLETALKKRLFARGAKAQVSTPDGFAEAVAEQARKRALQRLGLARANGTLTLGYSKVEETFNKKTAGLYLSASDVESADAAKLRAKLPANTKYVKLFTSEELGKALGRENLVHVAVKQGRQCQALVKALTVVEDLSNTPDARKTPIAGLRPDLKKA